MNLVLAFHRQDIYPVITAAEQEMIEIGMQQYRNCRMLMDELFCLRLFYNQEYFWSWSVKKTYNEIVLRLKVLLTVLTNYWIVFSSRKRRIRSSKSGYPWLRPWICFAVPNKIHKYKAAMNLWKWSFDMCRYKSNPLEIHHCSLQFLGQQLDPRLTKHFFRKLYLYFCFG